MTTNTHIAAKGLRQLALLWAIWGFLHLKAQIAASPYVTSYAAQHESAEFALFKAKQFLIENLFTVDGNAIEFVVDPLHASTTGELTTLVYECKEQKLSGLLLAFYGTYWNEAGVTFTGYGFKNLKAEQAAALLKKISEEATKHEAFLRADGDNNNISFTFDDIKIVLWYGPAQSTYRLRLFWNEFDSSWYQAACDKTTKRLAKAIDIK
ncbi:MAG: hypothetical protein ABI432_15740 [Flavobacteriales bacterium]